jgi:hypothetical protein
MSTFKKLFAALSISIAAWSVSSGALAWVNQTAKIRNVVTWESGEFMVITDQDLHCNANQFNEAGRAFYSAALSAFLSGRSVAIHCHDAGTNVAGYPDVHWIHRLILL